MPPSLAQSTYDLSAFDDLLGPERVVPPPPPPPPKSATPASGPSAASTPLVGSRPASGAPQQAVVPPIAIPGGPTSAGSSRPTSAPPVDAASASGAGGGSARSGGEAHAAGDSEGHAHLDGLRETVESETESLPPPVSAFTVTMLCLDVGYSALAHDFLAPAFAAFPDLLHGTVELPEDCPEPPLVSSFTRLPALPSVAAVSPTVLYVFHRSGLLPDFGVRTGGPEHTPGVADLLTDVPQSESVVAAFKAALVNPADAFVAVCRGHVVGVAVLEHEADFDSLARNFDLDSMVKLRYHKPSQVALLAHVALDPVFNHRRRQFLAEIMRLRGASLIALRVPEGDPAPGVMLHDLCQAAARFVPAVKPSGELEEEDAAALYLLTRRLASASKVAINHRLVIAGASDAGLACLERLLLAENLAFTSLTLLAFGGVTAGGVAAQYTVAALAKLGLANRVDVIDAEIVALDREERKVYLTDGTVLPFDTLVLASNWQDQTLNSLGDAADKDAHAVRAGRELLEEIQAGRTDPELGAVVYGGTLAASIAAQQLIAAGFDPAAITMVRPPAGLHQAAALASQAMTEIFGRNNVGVLPQEDVHSQLLSVSGGRPGAVLRFEQPTGEVVEVATGLLVTADVPVVDPVLFTALNDASIVFDGRIVVDGAFRTNDPHIFAVGRGAKFSRRYTSAATGGLFHEIYSSRELGSLVADVLIARFSGKAVSDDFPRLQEPKVVAGILPSKMQFIYSALPHVFNRPPSTGVLPGGRKLETRVEGLCRIDVDSEGIIAAALYCGKRRLDKSKLQQLVGLPVSYLDQLVEKYDMGEVHDLLAYLGEPWMGALYHDKFPRLVRKIALRLHEAGDDMGGDVLPAAAVKGMLGPKSKRVVQDCILDFVKSHRHELAMYHLPV